MYNDLREKLPIEIRDKAPEPLRMESMFSRGALYPENLQAVVKLVQVVLKDGGVVAALAASAEEPEAVKSKSMLQDIFAILKSEVNGWYHKRLTEL
ncbi:hypothetical protein DL766_004045 [Monosporascus sp. MC13-8B]|uniref:Uncharacterized protein n=1 Tax=Monosporascus cannonballus TaxID=155416 RepID=A0ABY0HH51_9PEZI|nr:hypothetical protein DL762_002649 [Monosporascus cannonballus]RYO92049.1 hypothetical protein DL763_004805 [Monosporascus cannonballus]RYP32288.1 hypothetical protein DL766_004045 [Monosporascus sp. MC13-8B]